MVAQFFVVGPADTRIRNSTINVFHTVVHIGPYAVIGDSGHLPFFGETKAE
jgi:hypothetical protein